jgi:hypothetical protein
MNTKDNKTETPKYSKWNPASPGYVARVFMLGMATGATLTLIMLDIIMRNR